MSGFWSIISIMRRFILVSLVSLVFGFLLCFLIMKKSPQGSQSDLEGTRKISLVKHSMDAFQSGEDDFFVSGIKNGNSRIMKYTFNKESNSSYMLFYESDKLRVMIDDSNGDEVFERIAIFDDFEEISAIFRRESAGVIVADPLANAEDIWPN